MKQISLIISLLTIVISLFSNPIAIGHVLPYDYFKSEEVNIVVNDDGLVFVRGLYNFRVDPNIYPAHYSVFYPFIEKYGQPVIKTITLDDELVYSNTSIKNDMDSYLNSLQIKEGDETEGIKSNSLRSPLLEEYFINCPLATRLIHENGNRDSEIYYRNTILRQYLKGNSEHHETENNYIAIKVPIDFGDSNKRRSTFVIEFYQKSVDKEYEYILDSTQTWEIPLESSILTVSLSDKVLLKSNYPELNNQIRKENGRNIYTMEKEEFHPDTNLIIKW